MPNPRRRRWLRLAIAACLLVLVILATGLFLIRREPTWWHEVPRTPEVTLAAERVENTLVSELSLARPDDGATPEYRSPEWTLVITDEEANAWLATRARSWLENRAGTWPAAVHSIQLAFRPNHLLVGIHLKEDGGLDHVVSVSGIPEVRENGSLWLKVGRAAVGGLPLPTGFILERVESMTGASASPQVLSSLDGKQPLLDQAILELDDGRRVRILKAEAKQGEIILTCRTEKD